MRCQLCGQPLQPIHGSLSCLNRGCPLFNVPQDDCCGGVRPESDTDEVAPGDRPKIPGGTWQNKR